MKRDDETVTQFTMRKIREEIIEECARACEARIKGTDGLPGGNDWGHHAPYNCEAMACAGAVRALSNTPAVGKSEA